MQVSYKGLWVKCAENEISKHQLIELAEVSPSTLTRLNKNEIVSLSVLLKFCKILGGLVAPGQGFFPEYYEGSYIEDNTEMIVSRGVGNSIIPFRINNKPEIIVAEFTKIAD